MKKLQSVSIILSVCTGLLVLMLVTLFATAAKQHFDSRQDASRRLSIATVAQQFVLADEHLRDERGAVDGVRLSAGSVSASDLDRIAQFHGRSRAALAVLTALLKTEKDVLAPPEQHRLARMQVRYEAGYAGMTQMLRLPARDRSRAIETEWVAATKGVIIAFEDEIIALSLKLSGIDSFIDEMMKAGNIAMAVRQEAGIDRGVLAGAMQRAAPLGEKDRILFAEMKVAAASPWRVILGAAKNPSFPAPLGKAVQQAQKIYFTEQVREYDAILAQLDRGMRPSLSSASWTQRSNRGLSAVTNVSRVAFEQARSHLKEQTVLAQRRFIGALSFIFVAIFVASLAFLLIFQRVIRPLRTLTGAMEAVIQGDMKRVIPMQDRRDEFGQFARTISLFRDVTLGRLLKAAGMAVDAYDTGDQLLETVALQRPDCLLLDLQMPGMSGLDVLKHLGQRHIHIPTIVITGSNAADCSSDCLNAGAIACLRKPLDADQLIQTINRISGSCQPDALRSFG